MPNGSKEENIMYTSNQILIITGDQQENLEVAIEVALKLEDRKIKTKLLMSTEEINQITQMFNFTKKIILTHKNG